jgi:hypothetical protein
VVSYHEEKVWCSKEDIGYLKKYVTQRRCYAGMF